MRMFFRFAGVVLSVVAMATPLAALSQTPAASDMVNRNAEAYLRVDGSRLVTPAGKAVELRGINVGGWLVIENWMCGITDSQDTSGNQHGRSALENLERRFGTDQAAQLVQAWEKNFITTRDLDRIRDAGFNLMRVPFSYRTLQKADGTWIRDAQGRIDFSRMDWLVREAQARNLYVIFDLHIWPEQRSDYEKIGRPDGQGIRNAMSELWTTVAAHYKGNGTIAAFDVINEYPGAWGVHDVLFAAVKKGDDRRVIAVGGFTYPEFRSQQAMGKFPNSILSIHFYADGPVTSEDIRDRLRPVVGSPIPVYVGEFLAEEFESAVEILKTFKVHWSSWTYKTVDEGEWGLFNYHSGLRIDLQKDSFASIYKKWSQDLVSGQQPGAKPNFYINEHRKYPGQ